MPAAEPAGRTGRLFVQMSGAPGSGKTTIAQAIVRSHGAVSLDHDVVKSAVLASGCRYEDAGPLSYDVLLALADQLLGQGHPVVLDSPCYYDELLASGRELAATHGARYRYVECLTDDIGLLDERLRGRAPLRSQRPSVGTPPADLPADQGATGTALFEEWIANMRRPAGGWLRLDTNQPVEQCVAQVRAFLDSRQPDDPR